MVGVKLLEGVNSWKAFYKPLGSLESLFLEGTDKDEP